MLHLIRTSGKNLPELALAGALLAAQACVYGFAGGGLPPHIRTVAILPFDNQTPEATLTQQVSETVREALEGRLGLRSSGEGSADAVVRGAILNYQPDIPLSVQPGDRGRVDVTRRRVQVAVSIEIFDQREGRVLWSRPRLVVDGEYEPPAEADGLELALEKLLADIVDGAQSQW